MNFTVRHICKTPLRHYHITLAHLYPQLYSSFRLSHTLPHHTCSSLSTAVFSFQTLSHITTSHLLFFSHSCILLSDSLRHYHITLALLYPQLYSPFGLLSDITTSHLLLFTYSCILLLRRKAVVSVRSLFCRDL